MVHFEFINFTKSCIVFSKYVELRLNKTKKRNRESEINVAFDIYKIEIS